MRAKHWKGGYMFGRRFVKNYAAPPQCGRRH